MSIEKSGHHYVVQQDDYIKLDSLLTVIPLSTQVKKRQELDVYIVKDNENHLSKDSLVKTMQISLFDRLRFFKYIGKLNNDNMSNTRPRFNFILQVNQPDASKQCSARRHIVLYRR